jgi:uncharacterized protein (DUF362 family)
MSSRRRFLQTLAGLGLTAAGCGRRPADQAEAQATPTANAVSAPPQAAAPSLRGKVCLVHHKSAFDAKGDPAAEAVRAMLDRAMVSLTGAAAAAEAWKQLFGPQDVVAIKANCLSGPPLCSHPEVALAIAAGLQQAGVPADKIIIYDRSSRELTEAGYQIETNRGPLVFGTDEVGYDEEPTVVKSVGSCFSRIVSQHCTAIINVPVLKDHDLAGMSGALKNHYGSISNPNKLHLDHCHPFIADLNCAPVLKDKQRLVIYDALYACCDGGPSPDASEVIKYGALMASTDAVASDAVALSLIEKLRAERKLKPLMSLERAPRWIKTAGDAEHDLGEADLARIKLTKEEVTA